MKERWYHAGPAGLHEILPPVVTGALSTAHYEFNTKPVCRRDRVYLLNSLPIARRLAAIVPFGMVYEVQPLGEVEPDDDFVSHGDGVRSVQCESAVIVGRHRRNTGRSCG